LTGSRLGKAEHYHDKVIVVAKRIGAKVMLGQAYLDLGLFHMAKKRQLKAKETITRAFPQTSAGYLMMPHAL